MPNKDSFLGLYNLMAEATKVPPTTFIGVVSSALPNLKIKFEGIELDKDDFLISNSMIISNNANVTCSTGVITHNLKDVLSVGDKVLIVKVNNTYVVLSKVVKL